MQRLKFFKLYPTTRVHSDMNMSGSSNDEPCPTSASDESIAAWALMELEELASHVHHSGGRDAEDDVEERGSVVVASSRNGSNDCPAVFGANYYVSWENKLGSDQKFVGWCTGIDYDARVITLTWTNQSVSHVTFKKFSEMMKNRLVKNKKISSRGRGYFMDLKGCDITAKYGDDGYFHAIVCDVSQHVVRVKWDTGEFTDYSQSLFESAVHNGDVVVSSSSVSSSVPTYMQQVQSELNGMEEIFDRIRDINNKLDEMEDDDDYFDYDSDESVWVSDGPLSDDE